MGKVCGWSIVVAVAGGMTASIDLPPLPACPAAEGKVGSRCAAACSLTSVPIFLYILSYIVAYLNTTLCC